MDNVLKIGHTVLWRGTWGKAVEQETEVMQISITNEGKKLDYQHVEQVDWDLLNEGDGRKVILTLTNGYWAYGYQLKQIK